MTETDDTLSRIKYISSVLDHSDKIPVDAANSLGKELALKKEKYVREHHKRKITQLSNGRWKTRVDGKDGKVRAIEKTDYGDLIEVLYEFYSDSEPEEVHTVIDEFEEWERYKVKEELIRETTVDSNRYILKDALSESFLNRNIKSVTRSDVIEAITEMCEAKPRTEKRLKAIIGILRNISSYAINQERIGTDFMAGINYRRWLKFCSGDRKDASDEIFTPDEIAKIQADMEKLLPHPYAYAILLSIEMGMRIGEICGLHWEDVGEEEIHIHRQQLRDQHVKPEVFYEVEYEKDEREYRHNGRYYPITDRIRELLDGIRKISRPDAVYVFELNGRWVLKTSLDHFLRKRCEKLGFDITNNHAFRKSLNSNVLIPAGLDSKQRAFVLGHSIETNERFYTYTRKEELDEIRGKLFAKVANGVSQKSDPNSAA